MLSRGKMFVEMCKKARLESAQNATKVNCDTIEPEPKNYAFKEKETLKGSLCSSKISKQYFDLDDQKIKTVCDEVDEEEPLNVNKENIIEPIPSTSSSFERTLSLDFSEISEENYIPTSSTEGSSDEETVSEKRLTRWRVPNMDNWKKNVIKKKRDAGLKYKSATGTPQAAKQPKSVNCNCKFKCNFNFNEDVRKKICKEYWMLNFDRKKDFLLHHVNKSAIKRRTSSDKIKQKNNSRAYFLVKNEKKTQVCKVFFLKTLCISHGPVDTALIGTNEFGFYAKSDMRGKATSVNKTPADILLGVKHHIESFPVTESHYCRKTSKRQYLDEKLSINKMYALYVEKCQSELAKPASSITYRRYFCNNYNFSFFKPKKDMCLVCEKYKKHKQNEEDYKTHIERKEQANLAKAGDKIRANREDAFLSVTFDLQSVLQIPSSRVSQMYYSRKICVYNLTVYEAKLPNKAHCFSWNEMNGQRGSSEIGTALLKWFSSLSEKIKEVTLFSDTCGGQNRNQFIAALFLFLIQNSHLDAIQHNFLESGHSQMEVDSMHSAIESAHKYLNVYSMNDWLNVFRVARSTKTKKTQYEVNELHYNDMKDLKTLGKSIIKNRNKDENGNTVQWLKIKCMRYEKSRPGIILFKYNYNEEFKILDVRAARRSNYVIPVQLQNLYPKMLSISTEKKNDLLKLCRSGAIPEIYHTWYENLSSISKKDLAPEPGANSESEEEV